MVTLAQDREFSRQHLIRFELDRRIQPTSDPKLVELHLDIKCIGYSSELDCLLMYEDQATVILSFVKTFGLNIILGENEGGPSRVMGAEKVSNLDLIAQKEELERNSHFILMEQKKLTDDTSYHKTTPDGRLVMEIVKQKLKIYSNMDSKGDKLIGRFDPVTLELKSIDKKDDLESLDGEENPEDKEAQLKGLKSVNHLIYRIEEREEVMIVHVFMVEDKSGMMYMISGKEELEDKDDPNSIKIDMSYDKEMTSKMHAGTTNDIKGSIKQGDDRSREPAAILMFTASDDRSIKIFSVMV